MLALISVPILAVAAAAGLGGGGGEERGGGGGGGGGGERREVDGKADEVAFTSTCLIEPMHTESRITLYVCKDRLL